MPSRSSATRERAVMTTREDLIDDDRGLWAEPAEAKGARPPEEPARISAEWLKEILRRADAIIVRDVASEQCPEAAGRSGAWVARSLARSRSKD